MPNKEDDLYLVIGTEDGYFDTVDMKKYLEAKRRLEGGYYDASQNLQIFFQFQKRIPLETNPQRYKYQYCYRYHTRNIITSKYFIIPF